MDNKFRELMVKGFGELNIALSEMQMEQFYQFYKLLTEWNKVMNLTTITDLEDVVTKHFVDSVSIVKSGITLQGLKMMDVGTGAGFPGIPLKIVFSDMEITLLDSLNKRMNFLKEVCSQLGLNKVELIHGRAEDYGQNKKYREQYDLCVSRAVANLSSLSEYCVPFVKKGGYFISYKSGKIEEEVKQAAFAVAKLGSKMEKNCSLLLPNGEGERSLVVIKKTKETPGKFPRKAGMPAKEPLK